MKFKNYVAEGRTDFWKDYTEYYIRELGKNKYEVSVWKRGDTPSAVYTVTDNNCDCPARGKMQTYTASKRLDKGRETFSI